VKQSKKEIKTQFYQKKNVKTSKKESDFQEKKYELFNVFRGQFLESFCML